jgi:hypothetical protein
MTNTLHRFGNAESFYDDYVISAIAAADKNDEGAVPKLKQFLRICKKYGPVNMGNGMRGAVAPENDLGPSVHWKRKDTPDWEEVIEGITKPIMVAAVFSSFEKAEECLRHVVDADLGLSVNISTSVENARHLAEKCGLKRHSVEYSLGFNDPHNLMANSQVVAVSSMCGHGMISSNLAKKMIDMVREGRRSPEKAAVTLQRFCPCGIFNTDRAIRLFEEARNENQ